MAMHKSEELAEAASVVFEQLTELGVQHLASGFIIIDKEKPFGQMWLSYQGDMFPKPLPIDFNASPILSRVYKSWKEGNSFYLNLISGEQFVQHMQFLKKIFGERVEQFITATNKLYTDAGKEIPDQMVMQHTFFSNGSLILNNITPIEEQDILNRFAKVFDQTYTRFLDLKKAEAQAKESQIETALERVRSRSMGMQKSEELKEVIQLVYEQFVHLNIFIEHTGFVMDYKARDDYNIWLADQHGAPTQVTIPYFDSVYYNRFNEAKEKGEDFFATNLTFEEKNRFYQKLFTFIPELPEEAKKFYFSCPGLAVSTVLLENVCLYIENFSGIPYSDEENSTLMRFGKVFQQAYTRFNDLQKAEAQVREGQIEASLEKVRSSALAMHNSSDISSTTTVVFEELKKLNIKSKRCGIALLSGNSFMGHVYAAATSSERKFLTLRRSIDMTQHQSLRQQYESWKKQENYFIEMNGDELKSYYQLPFFYSSPDYVPPANYERTEYGYYIPFSEGLFYAWTESPYSEIEINILNRFKSIIELTFRRFFDLQKAEAQAREAIKQASLDRVRGEIASMRTADDLNRITPIIWRELKTLEVPFIRCGVFIVDEAQEKVQVYLTTPDGKSLGVLNLQFNANEITTNTVSHWKKKEAYKEHWNKEEFINWTKSMMEPGQVQNAETYQGSSVPPESLDLHFVPFTQGMLYVGDVNPLTGEKLDLVQTLANAFAIAYARYEDFKNLEEAKNKIEITFRELKSAQVQLIHSEKMASLGELTAGIAHEIKNPLNFVNNFSDLSRELIDDVQNELQNNNNEEVLAILNDLKQNLEKINQHGKRADSIVKGMLLHSRGTSGEKTLTDINDLLDQYVTLAYHGMRAQNKEFNITIEKDYDESIQKINVVPQDISRVFLNIINNAGYAAYDRKKKSGDNNFSPTLKVSTKNLKDKVEIRIGDNGNGIPADHLDKIFQPFFTTKPTGEGTGLGLSLSYDIVTKVHGGELKVETKINKGSEFIIQLPLY
jgi:signal transduction histidine kinase